MPKLMRALLLLPMFVAGLAFSADTPFDTAKFDALNKEGKPILVAIHADWCLTGGDKLFEAWALRAAPGWLIGLTTSI